MNMPRFTGEASLYKTTQSYRGFRNRPAGDAGSTVVTPQLTCREKCGATLAACVLGCGAANVFCSAVCLATFTVCVDNCPTGGGVGGSRPCCPRGTRCSGECTKVPGRGLLCEGECIGPGEESI
jgi:hypothetical protein